MCYVLTLTRYHFWYCGGCRHAGRYFCRFGGRWLWSRSRLVGFCGRNLRSFGVKPCQLVVNFWLPSLFLSSVFTLHFASSAICFLALVPINGYFEKEVFTSTCLCLSMILFLNLFEAGWLVIVSSIETFSLSRERAPIPKWWLLTFSLSAWSFSIF